MILFCESQQIHHAHVMAMLPTRVPLPLDVKEDEPIYVSAKQYHAILRRRQYRAKLEAQNKLKKVRKPYLHESCHLNALKGARGSVGQFLNTKKFQQSRSPQLHLSAKISKTEVYQRANFKVAASATPCSDVTSGSNSDEMFQQADLRFSSYPPDQVMPAISRVMGTFIFLVSADRQDRFLFEQSGADEKYGCFAPMGCHPWLCLVLLVLSAQTLNKP
ncbi:Nuclear transcription factor Y subunit A-8 [Hibiscus syriacus]|uniref:Nuclear transcription factor Y subunit n=1 Tax=Hibiscus syriacus TaxID=106335 RepID=A0A6A3A8F6_HIBSY|nr:Nuclear transcription factor Y subunit A-8 [Hibiscus syriacus]